LTVITLRIEKEIVKVSYAIDIVTDRKNSVERGHMDLVAKGFDSEINCFSYTM
jgi:hypothetical protein